MWNLSFAFVHPVPFVGLGGLPFLDNINGVPSSRISKWCRNGRRLPAAQWSFKAAARKDMFRVELQASFEVLADESKQSWKGVKYPINDFELTTQAQQAVKAALTDGLTLMEIYFPSASADAAVSQELDANAEYLRKFLNAFREMGQGVRVMFPDTQEAAVHKERWGETYFKLSSLEKEPTPDDRMFVVVNPTWNLKEIFTAEKVWLDANQTKPLILFQAEIEKLLGDLAWPGYPKKEFGERFLQKIEPVFYIKRLYRGVLMRVYPGPWRVLLRVLPNTGEEGIDKDLKCVAEFEQRLKVPEAADLLIRAQRGEDITKPKEKPPGLFAKLFGG